MLLNALLGVLTLKFSSFECQYFFNSSISLSHTDTSSYEAIISSATDSLCLPNINASSFVSPGAISNAVCNAPQLFSL